MATPTYLCSRMREATIRGRLLFIPQSSRCGYYSRAATNRGSASIKIRYKNINLFEEGGHELKNTIVIDNCHNFIMIGNGSAGTFNDGLPQPLNFVCILRILQWNLL